MFQDIRNEVESRFAATDAFFQATNFHKGNGASVAKGLVFVQVYSIYEYTVKNVVAAAIAAINAHNHKICDISPTLLALVLDNELKSLRDSSSKNLWERRISLFQKVFSTDEPSMKGNAIPSDGSHYRYTQLEIIFKVFGIDRLPVRRKHHRGRIDEVVNHRNLIAHGTEAAEDIGRRYTRQEIVLVSSQMKSVCLLLISVFEAYCADGTRQKRKEKRRGR